MKKILFIILLISTLISCKEKVKEYPWYMYIPYNNEMYINASILDTVTFESKFKDMPFEQILINLEQIKNNIDLSSMNGRSFNLKYPYNYLISVDMINKWNFEDNYKIKKIIDETLKNQQYRFNDWTWYTDLYTVELWHSGGGYVTINIWIK